MAMNTPLLPPVTAKSDSLAKMKFWPHAVQYEQKSTRQRQITVLCEQDSMRHMHVKSIWP